MISPYHQQFRDQSSEEIQKKADAKQEELKKIFSEAPFEIHERPVRIAVLGCGDSRLIEHHRRIFTSLIDADVEITTFDISTDHLLGEDRVVQHDCTEPIPLGPFDITYAHVLMKFIYTEKQWSLLKNSFDVLGEGGMAIHVFDQEEIDSSKERLDGGLYAVDLHELKAQLQKSGIEYQELSLRYGPALILKK